MASIQIYFEGGGNFSLTRRAMKIRPEGSMPEGPRAGVGFLRRGQRAPSPPARRSGGAL